MNYDREAVQRQQAERLSAPDETAVLLHLKDAIAFLDAHTGRTANGILECDGYRFYYDDALALINRIERGQAA
jgi:hypothetical protein